MFEDVKDRIRDAVSPAEIEPLALLDLGADVDEISQHGEQVLADTLDDSAVDKRSGRRIPDLELDPARAFYDLEGEIAIAVEYCGGIVFVAVRVHHGERTTPQQIEEPGILVRFRSDLKLLHLALGQQLQSPARADLCIDCVTGRGSCFHHSSLARN